MPKRKEKEKCKKSQILVHIIKIKIKIIRTKILSFAGENVRAQLVPASMLVQARLETKRLQIYLALYGAIYKTA